MEVSPAAILTLRCILSRDGDKKYRAIPCKVFHKFQWDHKQLKNFLNTAVDEIIESYSYFIKEIDSNVSMNIFPEEESATKDFYYSSSIEEVKRLLLSCNYNFNKTFDTLKRLSESSCVDTSFVPEEVILNNKLREEEINFNTYPFGENSDRMAIKFKTSCEED